MKFDLWSDLHIDTQNQPGINFTPQADVLIIAGDISNNYLQANHMLESVASFYKLVIAVRGNHEYYENKTPMDVVDNMGPNADNVVLLTYKRPFYFHKKTMFLGLTGWYDFNFPGIGMSFDEQKELAHDVSPDMDCINFAYCDGETTSPEQLAKEHVNMLANQVRVANFSFADENIDTVEEIIVVTHTVPHVKGVVPPTHPYANGNGSFYNSQMHKVWEADKNHLISTWCFGHTHFAHDFSDHGIRFICNPRGRWEEQQARGKQSFPVTIDTETEKAYK
jgi:predicted phosphodiesterase